MGLHKSIKLSFLTVGHTKFSPDWCFGLLKQRFRRTKVDCLDDIVRVVESSAAINHAQLVGTQSGETVVPTFKWAEFLSSFLKRVPHIKRLNHFQFTSEDLGTVTVKRSCDGEEEKLDLINSQPSVEDFPEQALPSGLSDARQWYLFQKIREFCSDETKDIVCPLPAILPPKICNFFVSTSPVVNQYFSSKIFNLCKLSASQKTAHVWTLWSNWPQHSHM